MNPPDRALLFSGHLVALSLLTLVGCMSAPQVHPRALENNEICARYIASNDLQKAETYCELGLQFSPFYADLWANRGLIYLRQDKVEPAKDSFIKALRYNQEHAQSYNNLGFIYYREKSYNRARDNFTRSLKVNPDYLEARYNLALTHKAMGDKANARKEYRTVIAVNPNLADPHHDMGVMAIEDRMFEEAIDSLSKAVQLDPNFASAWQNVGVAYSETGRYQEARDAFIACIEADPRNSECRSNLAIMTRKAALTDPALKEIQESQQAENTPAAFYALAQKYRERGLRNEEERTYKRCLRLDPRYPLCHYGLFRVYEEDRRLNDGIIACRNFRKFAVAEEFPKEVEQCDKFIQGNRD